MPNPAPESAALAVNSPRVLCLDGVRGLAACSVVVFHFFYAFTPGPFMHWDRTGFSWFDTPVAVLWNGFFAVALFFALSGFVLAASGPRRLSEAPLLIGLRYFRLGVPAIASSIIAWAWLTGFPDAAHDAHAITGSSWFRWTYQAPIPPLTQAIWEGAIGVFLEGTTRFNNPLWTMQMEFLGSLLIYGLFALLYGRMRGWIMVAGLFACAFFGLFSLAAFCGGAIIHEWRHRLRDMPLWGPALGVVGLVLGATYPGHAAGPGVIDAIRACFGTDGFRQFGALLLIVSILTTPWLRRLLEGRRMQQLGEMSFPIYLVHVPLIVAPACWAYVALSPVSAPELAGLFVLVVAGTFVLARIFLILVESPLLRLLRTLRQRGRAWLQDAS